MSVSGVTRRERMPYYSMSPRRRSLPSRSSVTTVGLLASGCSQAGFTAASTARRRRGKNPRNALSSLPQVPHSLQGLSGPDRHRSVLRPSARGPSNQPLRGVPRRGGERAAGRASVNRYLGALLAMTGAIAQGRELVVHAAAAFDDLGQRGAARYCDALLADVELLAGNVPAARHALEALCAYCRRAVMSGFSGPQHLGLPRCSTKRETTALPDTG